METNVKEVKSVWLFQATCWMIAFTGVLADFLVATNTQTFLELSHQKEWAKDVRKAYFEYYQQSPNQELHVEARGNDIWTWNKVDLVQREGLYKINSVQILACSSTLHSWIQVVTSK